MLIERLADEVLMNFNLRLMTDRGLFNPPTRIKLVIFFSSLYAFYIPLGDINISQEII
jgi:hypothetical protein